MGVFKVVSRSQTGQLSWLLGYEKIAERDLICYVGTNLTAPVDKADGQHRLKVN